MLMMIFIHLVPDPMAELCATICQKHIHQKQDS